MFQQNIKQVAINLLLLVLTFGSAFGQTKEDLENKRELLKKEIRQTDAQLNDTRNNKKSILSEVLLLERQINQRESLITTIKAESDLTDSSVVELQGVISSLQSDITNLQEDYTKIMRHAYRNKSSNRRMVFLLSSENFNNAMKRWQYLKRYDQQRKRQVQLIMQTQESLNKKLSQLEKRREEKKILLAQEQQEQNKLLSAKKQKDQLIRQLNNQETKLAQSLRNKEQTKNVLSDKIDVAIRQNMAKSKAQVTARSPKVTSSTASAPKGEEANPEVVKTTAQFNAQKGKLPLPVSGKIVGKYGNQPHPDQPELTIKNNGIDIQTNGADAVKVVYAGEVTNVFFVPGMQNAVMVKHGEYYTVYSNLETTAVKKGDQLNAGSTVGKVGKSRQSDNFVLHFELWKSNQRLNPELWVK